MASDRETRCARLQNGWRTGAVYLVGLAFQGFFELLVSRSAVQKEAVKLHWLWLQGFELDFG